MLSMEEIVNILEPNELIVSITSTNITCYGGNNGTATLSISGTGNQPFDFF